MADLFALYCINNKEEVYDTPYLERDIVVFEGMVALAAETAIGQWFALRLLEEGFICQPAAHAWNVLKIEPPLTIAPEQIAQAVDAIASVFDEYRSVGKLLAHVTARVSKQALRA